MINKIVLASASPQRSDLLTEAGLKFEVCPAHVDEFEDPMAQPDALVHHNSRLKAEAIARGRPDALVLGADTTVSHKSRVLNKPADMSEARAMLHRLSGQAHTVYTAVTLLCIEHGIDELILESSQVTFKPLDDATITQYFSIVNPLDKAGAYGIQDGTSLILDHYEGSLANVMGLPIESLLERLAILNLIEDLRVNEKSPQRSEASTQRINHE